MHFFTYGWGSTKIEQPTESLSGVSMSTELMGLELVMVNSNNCEEAIGRKLKIDEMCLTGFLDAGTCTLVINSYCIYLTDMYLFRSCRILLKDIQ